MNYVFSHENENITDELDNQTIRFSYELDYTTNSGSFRRNEKTIEKSQTKVFIYEVTFIGIWTPSLSVELLNI